jgi:hypothetical protein
MRTRFLALGATVALMGCASGTLATSSPSQRTSTQRRTNVISNEEIASGGFQTVDEVIRKLRPQWPHSDVFVDNAFYGDFSSLGQIALSRVKELHSLTPSEAQMKWGSRVQGIIWVVTK